MLYALTLSFYFQDLSCSEAESEEQESKPRPRKNSRWFEKRNEKGETALHTACISGNLKRVTELLEKVSDIHKNSSNICGAK